MIKCFYILTCVRSFTCRASYSSVGNLSVRGAQRATLVGSRGNDQTHDEPVQSQSFSEDENENHTHEELGLLSVGSDTSITNDTDGETGSEGRKTDSEASSQVGIARVLRVRGRLVELSVDDDGGDEAVDTQDTSHDNGDDGPHDEIRSHDTHRGDTHTSLGGAVGRTEVRKDNSRGDAHEAEESRAGHALLSSKQGRGSESEHSIY